MTTRIRMLFLFSTAMAMGWAFACAPGPVYEMKTDYLPPASPEGKACLERCEAPKVKCQEAARQEFEAERRKARQGYEQCLLSQKSSPRTPILCNDPSSSIQLNDSPCTAAYNRCYANCGGKVEEKNVCTRNCR